MRDVYAAAEAGVRQVLFVSGEPGIGKTTVVAEFVERVAGDTRARTAIGQCLEHYGAGEAYQPVLDAVTRLCRQPGAGEIIRLLQQHAPSWVAQLPADLFSSRVSRRAPAGTTPERMLRELNHALEALSMRRPVLLWFEDLHWSDPSTLEWLGAFAQLQREEQGQILREHGMIGHRFGEAGFVQDIRLACFGLDKDDSDFVIGLIGRELHPLSACIQAMRGTRQTSQFMQRMGPFFIGRTLWQSPLRS